MKSTAPMKATAPKTSSRKKRKKPASSVTSPALPTTPSNLSSANIAKVLSGFMTFRATLKDLSYSLQRMQSLMDSVYQVVGMASNLMGKSRQRRFGLPSNPFQPFPRPRRIEQEEIPRIQLPFEQQGEATSSTNSPLKNFDFSQLWNIMQSPLFQGLISGLLNNKAKPTVSAQPKTKNRGKGGN
jgi:hypothetical protein